MSLLDYKKEFFVKAAMHAKHARLKALNRIEADLMTTETMLRNMQGKYSQEELNLYENEVKAIRKVIKEKKLKIL
jgi:hypothetical protein